MVEAPIILCENHMQWPYLDHHCILLGDSALRVIFGAGFSVSIFADAARKREPAGCQTWVHVPGPAAPKLDRVVSTSEVQLACGFHCNVIIIGERHERNGRAALIY